ncbi:MAG: ATPase, T2SS/T4P/T4SS family, partial [Pseudomonadota bacterium]
MTQGVTSPQRQKLGELLLSQGRITPEQLTGLLELQKQTSKPLGKLLIEKQILTDDELIQILGEQMGIPHVWLRKGLVDPKIVHLVSKDKALHFQIVPMFCVNKVLTVATADPYAIFVFDELAKLTGMEVQPVLCRTNDILDAIRDCYRDQVIDIEDVMSSIEETDIELVEAFREKEITEIMEMAEGSPVINLTNMILLKAVRDGASDIHLEPRRGKFQIRVRIDGVLYEMMAPKPEMHPAVVSRLKIMAHLDIAERRMPQDGRFQVSVDSKIIDVRFSSMPGIHGEKVVLRILDKSRAVLDLNRLGLSDDIGTRFKTLLKRPYGLILVCGPTGSGKTTTLYSSLVMLNSVEKNVMTIEDP